MRYKITTPVKGFTGTVAGAHFADGKAETDDPRAVAYFRRQGYAVEQITRRSNSGMGTKGGS